MTPLVREAGSDDLIKRFFPGLDGAVYLLSKVENGPVLGLLSDPEEPGNTVLVGAGQERSWSEQVPLEGAHRIVTRIEPLSAAIGDLRKNGLADILFVLEIESRPREGKGRQVRKAAYLFELGKRARLVWYQSLSVEGEDDGPCTGGELSYHARPRFVVDDEGKLGAIDGTFDEVAKSCEGGDGCKAGQRVCRGDRDSGKWHLEWDEELQTYRKTGTTEVVLRIPDVTL